MSPTKERPLVLQYSSTFIRDCWFEDSNHHDIFVVRQIEYQDNGTVVAKEIRFVENEISNLMGVLVAYNQEKVKSS